MGKIEIPNLPALVEGKVFHTRKTPLVHHFSNRVYLWLVDLDSPPSMGLLLKNFSSFNSKDHIGDPDKPIKDNIQAFCVEKGIDVTNHRVLMLANARILKHTFDPISVFWLLDEEGELTCIVAEVHNTYGGRHAYLLSMDEHRAKVRKDFYVSPFFTVDGDYKIKIMLEKNLVLVNIVLEQGGVNVFTATFRGQPKLASRKRLLSLLFRMPFITNRNSLSIRIHGILLWLKGLPVVPRKSSDSEEDKNDRSSLEDDSSA